MEYVEDMIGKITEDGEIKPVWVEKMRERKGRGQEGCKPVIAKFRNETEIWKVMEIDGEEGFFSS